jgi:hypothetical protein
VKSRSVAYGAAVIAIAAIVIAAHVALFSVLLRTRVIVVVVTSVVTLAFVKYLFWKRWSRHRCPPWVARSRRR